MSLHDKIMSLPCEYGDDPRETWSRGYKIGHRDARHAAAELALDADAEIERLRDALHKIADWESNWGPYPENNEAWRAMAVITAREAVGA